MGVCLALALSCGGRAADGDASLPLGPGLEPSGGATGGRGGFGGTVRPGRGIAGVGERPAGSAGVPAPAPMPEPAPSVDAEGCPVLVNRQLEVRSQAEIEALRGCRRIEGDLSIYPFSPFIDLTPLSALERVGGTLTLGDPFVDPAPLAFVSLAGLESLRSVGGLSLRGVRAPSLEGLSGLRELTRSNGVVPGTGFVFINECPELTDLRGLENLEGLQAFVARSNPSLISVAGLRVPPAIEQFEIWDSPVSDISALGRLTTVAHTLWFINTALTNVVDLGSLARVDQLQFWRNSALVDLSGLSALVAVRYLNVIDNSSLEALPELPQLQSLDSLSIDQNPSLREVLAMPALQTIGYASIANNPLLSRVVALSQVQSATDIYVDGNPELAELDLGRLELLTSRLVVTHNASLDSASVPRPTTATFILVGGNRGEPLQLDPCPWARNASCESPPSNDLCAWGSDRDDCGTGGP